MKLRTQLGLLIGMVSITQIDVEACSYSIPSYVVASPVAIEVLHRERPVSQLPVIITQFDPQSRQIQIAEATTDEGGRATFEQLPEGRYFVMIGHKEVPGQSVQIRVVGSSKLKHLDGLIRTEWPAWPVIESKFPKGTIRPVPLNSINLRDAMTQTIAATTTPKSDGTFDFGPVPDGLYSINFKVSTPSSDRSESVPVQVTAGAARASLTIELLAEPVCGMTGYRDLTAQPQQVKRDVETKCGLTLHGVDQYEFRRTSSHTDWVPAEKFNRDDFDAERALVSVSKEGLVAWVDRQDGSPIEHWSDWTNYCVENDGDMRVHSELTLFSNGRDVKNVIREYEVTRSGVRTVIQEAVYDDETRMPVSLADKDLNIVGSVPVPLGPGAFPSLELVLEQTKANAQTH